MSDSSAEVIKVGGSLLSRSRFADSLNAWLESQDMRPRLLVVGGGEIVNIMRGVHTEIPLRQSTAHWLAIEAMELQARRVHYWLPQLSLANSLEQAREQFSSVASSVMLCRDFLRREEPMLPGTRLPIGWQVTSDSIAARLAICLGARLRLLKSRPQTKAEKTDWQEAVRTGFIDEFFPTLATSFNSVSVEPLIVESRRIKLC